MLYLCTFTDLDPPIQLGIILIEFRLVCGWIRRSGRAEFNVFTKNINGFTNRVKAHGVT